MKKIFAIAAMMVATMPLAAQETYENAKIAMEDLNGTARYVGMGGAMEALGADISTISTNPAGIGLFRKSNINVSFGLVSQANVSNAVGGNKTVGKFEEEFAATWGIGVQVASADDSKLADNKVTLVAAGK